MCRKVDFNLTLKSVFKNEFIFAYIYKYMCMYVIHVYICNFTPFILVDFKN